MGRRRLLITGAGGFVGAAIAKAAVAAGDDVIALVRNGGSRLAGIAKHISLHRADLADAPSVARLIRSVKPDVVIHSAWEGVGGALRSDDIQFENIRTTIALADAAIAAGTRKFVGIGSQAEYGRYDRRIVEDDLPRPTMLYGAAKLAANHLSAQRCGEAEVAFAWLRLFSVYGPGDNPNWLIPSTAASLVQGSRPLCTAGTQRWDYLHIDDVAEGVLAVARNDRANGVFNLSSGEAVDVRRIVEMLRDIAAPSIELTFGDIPFAPNQIMHLEGDNHRLRKATGWKVRIPLWEGLRQVVDELRIAA